MQPDPALREDAPHVQRALQTWTDGAVASGLTAAASDPGNPACPTLGRARAVPLFSERPDLPAAAAALESGDVPPRATRGKLLAPAEPTEVVAPSEFNQDAAALRRFAVTLESWEPKDDLHDLGDPVRSRDT